MNCLFYKLAFFTYFVFTFDTILFSQDIIEEKIDSFLMNAYKINGKQKIKKVRSTDTVEYFAFGKKTNALIYYYRTIKNQHGIFKLDPVRFYFLNDQLLYVRVYFPERPKNHNTAFYEFKDAHVIQKFGNLDQSTNVIEGYIFTSNSILKKAEKLY